MPIRPRIFRKRQAAAVPRGAEGADYRQVKLLTRAALRIPLKGRRKRLARSLAALGIPAMLTSLYCSLSLEIADREDRLHGHLD